MDDFTRHLQKSLTNKAFKNHYNRKKLKYKIADTLTKIKVRRLKLSQRIP